MKTIPSLTGSHLRTYERIFQHPLSHNLEWRDVHSLLGKLGSVVEEPNGNLKVTRNGQNLVLHPTRAKDLETEEIMTLRHFLKGSETPVSVADGNETHWLLVIDHHEVRLFHCEMEGGVPLRILSQEAGEYFRHSEDSQETSRGQEKPDPNTYFAQVAKALQSPGPILVFGTGKGTSSEMEQFLNWSRDHHPELAKRIVGSHTIDEHHLTEGQILAKARGNLRRHPRHFKFMNTNPLNKGILSENFVGIGTVTREMVEKRAAELALINGRAATDVSQSDWDQAKRELTGEPEMDPKEAILESAPESERWDPLPGTPGHQAAESSSEDDDDEGPQPG